MITVNFETFCPEIAEAVGVLLFLNVGLSSQTSFTAVKSLTDEQLYNGEGKTSEVLCHEWTRLGKIYKHFKLSPEAYRNIAIQIWR